jgi:hypothetical protein
MAEGPTVLDDRHALIGLVGLVGHGSIIRHTRE